MAPPKADFRGESVGKQYDRGAIANQAEGIPGDDVGTNAKAPVPERIENRQ